MQLSQYDFELPEHFIAQHPLPERTDARLLLVRRQTQTWEHLHIRDLPNVLNSGDTLVFNDTKVIPARLIGNRSKSGGKWEGLLLEFLPNGRWKIMSKTRGKLVVGERISLYTPSGKIGFALELESKLDDGTWIVRPGTNDDALTAIEKIGWVPIPPYIRDGKMDDSDREDYQTVFAQHPGAIAAPTAGLHFTQPLLTKIESNGVALVPLTLHVGAGTFRPITVDDISQHVMHSEWGCVSRETVDTINTRRTADGRTVAVGTTSVRVLESASQSGVLEPFSGNIDLFIRPPYTFRSVDALLTNFHFPRSTLYILVRTFGGDTLIQNAYEDAIRKEYRFFSYGDAMLIMD